MTSLSCWEAVIAATYPAGPPPIITIRFKVFPPFL
jgi:hypothetical protein